MADEQSEEQLKARLGDIVPEFTPDNGDDASVESPVAAAKLAATAATSFGAALRESPVT
ncbi:hypothetical protein D3C83_220460 [compost metagenome]